MYRHEAMSLEGRLSVSRKGGTGGGRLCVSRKGGTGGGRLSVSGKGGRGGDGGRAAIIY